MRPSTTARRYAQAAFQVAKQDNNIGRWLQELRDARDTCQRADVYEFFRDPGAARDEQLQTIDELFKGSQPHVLNLLRILVSRHRLHLLPSIVEEFEGLERAERNVIEAYVTVAREIGDAERDVIVQRLGELTGKQVEIYTRTDPSILGGIVVRMGDRVIDASVAGRLQRLRQEMAV